MGHCGWTRAHKVFMSTADMQVVWTSSAAQQDSSSETTNLVTFGAPAMICSAYDGVMCTYPSHTCRNLLDQNHSLLSPQLMGHNVSFRKMVWTLLMRAKKKWLFVLRTLKMRKNLGIYRVKNAIQAIAEPHECCLLLPRRKLGLKMSQIFKKIKPKKEGENPANCGWCQGYSAVPLIVLSTLDSAQRGEKKENISEGEWRREEEERGSCSVGRSVGWVGNGSVSEWSIMGLTGFNTGGLSGWLRWDVDWPVWDRGCRPDLSQLAVSQKRKGVEGGRGWGRRRRR